MRRSVSLTETPPLPVAVPVVIDISTFLHIEESERQNAEWEGPVLTVSGVDLTHSVWLHLSL
jgi:hypothetical protein